MRVLLNRLASLGGIRLGAITGATLHFQMSTGIPIMSTLPATTPVSGRK